MLALNKPLTNEKWRLLFFDETSSFFTTKLFFCSSNLLNSLSQHQTLFRFIVDPEKIRNILDLRRRPVSQSPSTIKNNERQPAYLLHLLSPI